MTDTQTFFGQLRDPPVRGAGYEPAALLEGLQFRCQQSREISGKFFVGVSSLWRPSKKISDCNSEGDATFGACFQLVFAVD